MPKRLPFDVATCWALGLLLAAAPACATDESWPYRIERGDTLIGVRDRLLRPDADWRILQRANRIANPRRLIPGSTLKIPLSALREHPLVAEVLYASGTVTVQRAGAAPEPLIGGASLAAGDLVRTGPQSSAALRFADGARVLVRPDSTLRIERTVRLGDSPMVDTRMRLERGGADTRVPKENSPRFEIRTPVANLGVRGTEFRVRADEVRTAVEVLEGRVEASAREARTVDAGYGALASERRVTAPTPLAAAPDLAALPRRIERLPLRLDWKPAAAGIRFRAQVYRADEPDRLVLDGLFGADGARWSEDLPDGRYQLRARAVADNGLEGQDATALFTLKARPEPPFLTRPRAGERTPDETANFAWTRNPAAARYRLQLADAPDLDPPRLDRDDLTGNALGVAVPVGTHYWRLASIRADGDQGPWSDTQAFTRVELPPPPESQPPRVMAEGVELNWRAAASMQYDVQVAPDLTFTAGLQAVRVEQPQWLLRRPEPGRYFVRVRSIDGDGFVGPFGAPQVVDVPYSPLWWLLLLPVLLL
jgi:hypothetical protein